MAVREFHDVLRDVFGPRCEDFGPDLRSRLEQLHREGIMPVPPEVFAKWERPEDADPEDPREAPGRLAELDEVQARVIDKLEDLVVEVDRNEMATRTLGFHGDDLARARHQFHVRLESVERQVDRMLAEVRRWR